MISRICLIQTLIAILCTLSAFGQIEGTVSDESGTPLPYVNIFVKNTSVGTTTNFDGFYRLELKPGSYTIVYQYIGYQTEERNLDIDGGGQNQDIILKAASYEMPAVTIKADAEDPAYAIIRKAQERRKTYRKQNTVYECDAYVRGFNKIYDAPEKIMGVEVGDMEGALDSTRQGVVYLSESVSKMYVSGGKTKEVMYSSKVSGDDQGYSFNSAQEMDFNFYDNTLDINRRIVSPIANNAMSVYRYKLEGAYIDENGQLVNKIKVIPKNKFAAAFFGYIYINEDLWNINSLDLSVTSDATQLPFIDTLSFKQVHIPVEKDRWLPLSNVIQFRMGALGFEIGGNFACVYSNYVLDDIDVSVFNNEIYIVESEANAKSEMYWDSIRPIPLTTEERLDYVRKDSIRLIRESPEYKDSVDREYNKFQMSNLMDSYDHRNSEKLVNWTVGSPLSDIQVNTIQGWNGSFSLQFRKKYDEQGTRLLRVKSQINYATATNIWRPQMEVYYRANRKNNLSFFIQGGRDVSQFNRTNPISSTMNSIMTLMTRRNFMKIYDKQFLTLRASRDLGAWFTARVSLDYEDRSALVNNYNGSIFFKDSREFTDNLSTFEDHQALIFRASLRIKLGQKLVSFPDRTFKAGSDWPTIWLHYKKGIEGIAGSDVAFDLLHAQINKRYSLGSKGDFSFNVHGGVFLNTPEFFIDNMHFRGNRTFIGYPSDYDRNFLLMPYYDFSTPGDFLQWHVQHDFNGFILSKIPLVRQLNWQLVAGHKYLLRDGTDYMEWHLGLDNVGFGIFRLLRIDAVWYRQFTDALPEGANNSGFGIVAGLKFDI